MITTTLFNVIKSELINEGFNEFVDDDGTFVFFDDEHQFITKMLTYDDDVSDVVDRLFTGLSLTHRENDEHFKKTFLMRFFNRQINFQTIESFKVSLLSTFLMQQYYINTVYADLDKYINQSQINANTNKQTNEQRTDGSIPTNLPLSLRCLHTS